MELQIVKLQIVKLQKTKLASLAPVVNHLVLIMACRRFDSVGQTAGDQPGFG